MNGSPSAANEQHFQAAPMSFSQILERIWWIFRKNWLLFLGLGWVPAGALVVAYALMTGSMFAAGFFRRPQIGTFAPGAFFRAVIPGMLAGSLLFMLVYAVFQAASCYAALQVNRGNSASFRESYAAAWRRGGRYTWLLVLHALCVSAPIALVVAPLALAAGLQLGPHRGGNPGVLFVLAPLLVLAYAGGGVYAVWMTLRLALAFPACVAEGIPSVLALKRSTRLTRNAKGRIFLVLLVVYAVSYAAFLVLELVVMALAAIAALLFSGMHFDAMHGSEIAAIACVVFGLAVLFFSWMAMIWSAYGVALSVLYEDQRLRMDGGVPVPAGGLV